MDAIKTQSDLQSDNLANTTLLTGQLFSTYVEHPSDTVYTKPRVAEFMLDVAAYTADAALHRMRFVDPAAGPGAIVLAAIDRLMPRWRIDPNATVSDLV